MTLPRVPLTLRWWMLAVAAYGAFLVAPFATTGAVLIWADRRWPKPAVNRFLRGTLFALVGATLLLLMYGGWILQLGYLREGNPQWWPRVWATLFQSTDSVATTCLLLVAIVLGGYDCVVAVRSYLRADPLSP